MRCVLIGIQNENLLASTDQDELKRIDPLLSLKITLGSIERRDFPVHYDHVSQIFCNSRRSIQEYKSLLRLKNSILIAHWWGISARMRIILLSIQMEPVIFSNVLAST